MTAFAPGGGISGPAPLPGSAAPAAIPPQLLAAMASYAPYGFGGTPSPVGTTPIGAAAFLPGGVQPGPSGAGYQLQPYGFTPAPAMGAAGGAKPFFPGQSLQNQARMPAIPASWSPEMKQRFLLLQQLLGDRRELDPALFAARIAQRGARVSIGGGFEGKGPAAPGGGYAGERANSSAGRATGSSAQTHRGSGAYE